MAKIVINPTSASKKEIPIAGRAISIGRDPSNDLVLSDSMVSRRHAILEQRDESFVLRDNNSSNGTLVNGDRVEKEQALHDGDLVAIGSVRLLFQLEDTGDSAVAPDTAGLAKPTVGPDPASSTVGADVLRCPSCGKPPLRGDRFCRGCGRSLAPGTSMVKCSRCGTEIPLPADFCGSCGASVASGASGSDGVRSDAAEPRHESSESEAQPPEPPARARRDRPRMGAGAAARPSASPSPSPSAVGPARGPARARAIPSRQAGFGIRLVAALIDAMILGTPALIGVLVWSAVALGGAGDAALPGWAVFAGSLFFPILSIGYHVYFIAARGATPGKSLVGIVVETESGESPIGYSRAVTRVIGYFLSSIPFGLGFLWVAFSPEKRGWHDHLASTRVSRAD